MCAPAGPGEVSICCSFTSAHPLGAPLALERVLVQTVSYTVALAFWEMHDFLQQRLFWILKVIELQSFVLGFSHRSEGKDPTQSFVLFLGTAQGPSMLLRVHITPELQRWRTSFHIPTLRLILYHLESLTSPLPSQSPHW